MLFNQILKPIKFLNFKEYYIKKDIVFYIILFLIAVEFLYSGYIPLFEFFKGNLKYDDLEFGIKTLHVITMTLSSFYFIHLFYQFLIFKKLIIFIKLLILFSFPLLLLARSSLLMLLLSCVFVYLFSINKIKMKSLITLFLLGVFVLYLFGLMGNIRETANSLFMTIAEPSEKFEQTNIPTEFMWPYIYIASPVAILQYNMSIPVQYELDKLIIGSMVPDIISKRTELYDEIQNMELLVSWLNVGTQYVTAYRYFGLLGMYIIFFSMSLFVFVYTIFLKGNKYFFAGYTVLILMVLFGIFSNMWVYSALSLQFIYPFLLKKIEKITLRKKVMKV